MNSGFIIDSLIRRLDPKKHAWFKELRLGTGYAYGVGDVEQRIDLFVMHLWPSEGLKRISYEVKVSRNDFIREIREPQKRAAAMRVSEEFWFVTPEDLVKPEEVPALCGLIVVSPNGSCRIVVKAKARSIDPPPVSFLAAVARRAAQAERNLRGYKMARKQIPERPL